MRTLTSTLLAAQKSGSAAPYVKVEVLDDIAGVPRPTFTRLYTGSEADFYHDVTCPGDGSLVRARVDPATNYLYVQRVASPGPSSDFSSWSYLNAVSGGSSISLVSRGAGVHLFYVAADGKDMFRRESSDYGATWSSPIHVLNPDVAAISWLAAAISDTGGLALFYASSSHVVYFTRLSGYWSNPESWSNTVASITGMDCLYQGDWDLVVTGTDSSTGDATVWTCIYGDGADQAVGTWSSLRGVSTARPDSGVSFHHPSMALSSVFRLLFVERYTGSSPYQRPLHSHALASASFADNLWREPVPFDLSAGYGAALAATSSDLWLCTPYGVWCGPLASTGLELTGDILEISLLETPEGGSATLVLRNEDGRYNSIGSGDYASLRKGSEVRISPGHVTPAGEEVSQGPVCWIEGWEHRSSPGRSVLVLFARGGWWLLSTWWARRQYTWDAGAATVAGMLEFILARGGLELDIAGASGDATTLTPAFTVHPGESGAEAVRRLLAKVPDALVFRGHRGLLVHPQASDATGYVYGTDHSVLEGRYGSSAQEYSRVQVFGSGGMGEAFAWEEVSQLFDRLLQVHDLSLDTLQKAQDRASAVLREQLLTALGGEVTVPASCGQELYDVIEVTDVPAGLASARRRVLGLALHYSRGDRPRYQHTITLGGV